MIRLKLLGLTPDLEGLVFTPRPRGRKATHWVPVDESLVHALRQLDSARARRGVRREAEPADDGDGAQQVHTRPPVVREQSRLTPRDIQQLLREGRSVREVAALAGVEREWVERFVGPVLHEMGGIIQMTRQAHQSRSRLGVSGLPIEDAVRRNLEDRRATPQTLEEFDAGSGWEAHRVSDRVWRVRLRFRHRGQRRSAEWDFNSDSREAAPRNQLAAQLGWWPEGPGRTIRPVTLIPQVPPDAIGDDEARAERPTRGRRAGSTTRKPRKRAGATGRATASTGNGRGGRAPSAAAAPKRRGRPKATTTRTTAKRGSPRAAAATATTRKRRGRPASGTRTAQKPRGRPKGTTTPVTAKRGRPKGTPVTAKRGRPKGATTRATAKRGRPKGATTRATAKPGRPKTETARGTARGDSSRSRAKPAARPAPARTPRGRPRRT